MIGFEALSTVKEVLSKYRQDHCTLIFLESGRVFVRRIHGITTQAADGSLNYSEGSELPIAIVIESGNRQDEKHFVQVLSRPTQASGLGPNKPLPWLSLGRLVTFLSGALIMHMIWAVRYSMLMAHS